MDEFVLIDRHGNRRSGIFAVPDNFFQRLAVKFLNKVFPGARVVKVNSPYHTVSREEAEEGWRLLFEGYIPQKQEEVHVLQVAVSEETGEIV